MTSSPAHSFATAVLVAASISGGCRTGDEAAPSTQTVDASAAPVSVAPSSDLTGIWTVVGHHIPGVSAIGDAEARAWHGRTVRLTDDHAISDVNHCDNPTYTTESVAKDPFLASEFRLPPGSLAPVASRQRVTLLDVFCADSRWVAMGGRMIGIDTNRVLAPWDGVFFELARDRDFRALGQEPFWNLLIQKGKELRFTYDLGEREAVTPAPGAVTDSAHGAGVYHAVTQASDLRVVIEPIPCADVMSGKPFPNTVTVTLNGQSYHGCGEPVE